MEKGSLMLVLHAHLPYVRHPEHDYSLEELWLYEAAVETYLPLLEMLGRLAGEGVGYRLTLSLSPTLLEMLSDPLLNARLLRHIEGLLVLAEKELLRTRGDASFGPLARMYHGRVKKLKSFYERDCGGDIVGALRALGGTGRVEFITTAATHAYLPNLAPHPEAVTAQLETGIRAFKGHMGLDPRGVWLPECGYYPGLDEALSMLGAGFCFLETHGVLHARPRPPYGVFRPVRCPSGAAAFGRDADTARRVWCARSGYPGHPDYRDFYRDIGHDLPMHYIKEHVHPDGIRVQTGIKYHRVTGSTGRKAPYVRERALKRAKRHALDFIEHLSGRARTLGETYGFAPLITAPYDAELFGHWWFEGVEWLEFLLRGLDARGGIRTVTPTEYLAESPGPELAAPQLSSWGEGGYGATWTADGNGWAAAEILRACGRMKRLIAQAKNPSGPGRRALAQALRELLLAQSSDWTFLMHRDTAAEYAEDRLRGHLANFRLLEGMLAEGRVDMERLAELERKNNVFPGLDHRVYGSNFA
jgi:1,4-alpha-glucan branching enzyme